MKNLTMAQDVINRLGPIGPTRRGIPRQETNMKSILNTLLKIMALAFVVIYFTACGGGGGGSGGESTSAPALKSPVIVDNPELQDPSAPVPNNQVSVSYRKLVKTITPNASWPLKTIAVTASCIDYQTRIYCWDDGLKTLSWSNGGNNYGPYKHTFWGLMNASPYQQCSGGCTSSFMTSPIYISPYIGSNLGSAVATVNQVLTTGVATAQTCTDANGLLSCPDFVIDLNQPSI